MRPPSPLLAVDETLYPHCGHFRFQQYNLNTLAKYGMLYQSLCNSLIPYNYYSVPYPDKSEEVKGPTAKYYITRTDEYSKYLIKELSIYCNL